MVSKFGQLFALVVIAGFIAVLAGCGESSQPVATGKGQIRGINSIVTAPEVLFKIEERNIGGIDYKESTTFDSFDDLTYNFNFDMFVPGIVDPLRIATRNIDVETDQQYTIVLAGTIEQPTTFLWEDTLRTWGDTETVFELSFAHLAPSLGEIDVYFDDPDVLPIDGQRVRFLAYGDRIPGQDFASGEYRMYLTNRGKPNEVIFKSRRLSTTARTRISVAIFEPDPSTTTSIGVNVINETGASSSMPEAGTPAQLRLFHGAVDIEGTDTYLDEDFDNVIFGDLQNKELSAFTDLSMFSTTMTVTPAGNVGTTIIENIIPVPSTERRTIFLGGTLAQPFFSSVLANGRPLESFPVVRVTNLAVNVNVMNVFLTEAGTIIDDQLFPTVPALPSRIDSGFFGADTGRQELTIALIGSIEPIATPLEFNLRNGDVVDVVILDTVDPNVFELLVIDGQ